MLDSTQIDQFWRDGFLVLRSFTPQSVCAPLREAAELALAAVQQPLEYEAEVAYPGSPSSLEAEGGQTVRRLLAAYDRGPLFQEWACSKALTAVLRALLGEPISLVRAHHNCIMTKQPQFSSATGWHQDLRYWSFEQPDLITAWLALTPEYPDNGALQVLPRSHVWQAPLACLDAAQFLRPATPECATRLHGQQALSLDPGDLLLFHARTFHAAGRNLTDRTKLSLVFTYKRQDNRANPDTRSASLPEVPLDDSGA